MPQFPNKFPRLLIVGLTVPVVALNIFILSLGFQYFQRLITLLSVAAIFAFLLNYPVKILQRLNVRRGLAIAVVLFVTLFLIAFLAVTLVPSLLDQTTQLLKNIPDWIRSSSDNLERWDNWAKQRNLPLDLEGVSSRVSLQLESQLQEVAKQAVGFAWAWLSWFLDLLLIVVLAVYMLVYGQQVWKSLINLLPVAIRVSVDESIRLNFQNFFLSQLLLALVMTLLMTPIFLILNVPFSLLFAIVIGISQLIPLIGATLGIGLVVILVMLQNFWLGFWVGVMSVIMQQLKDNIIAPKLMGEFTGLNPLWIFIAVLMGAQIAGLLGVVVAVPIAGIFKDTIVPMVLAKKEE